MSLARASASWHPVANCYAARPFELPLLQEPLCRGAAVPATLPGTYFPNAVCPNPVIDTTVGRGKLAIDRLGQYQLL